MLKYILYPMFGLGVVGFYGISAATATDATSVPTQRSTVAPEHRGTFATAPIVWRTGFHGPAARRPTYSSGSRGGGGVYLGGGSYGSSGGFGGFGGGK